MSAGLRAGTNNDGYLQINATDVLTALSSGRIGIGTSTPTQKFHIYDGNNHLRFGDILGGSTPVVQLEDSTGFPVEVEAFGADLTLRTGNTRRLTILSDGNVGIGITNPSTKLQVSGTIFSNLSGTGSLYLGYTTSSSRVAGAVVATESPSYGATGKLGFYVTCWGLGTNYGLHEVMAIDQRTADEVNPTIWMQGKVGIGTTNPTEKLQVHDGRIICTSNSLHGVLSGYSTGVTVSGQTNNANIASNCMYTAFSQDPTTNRTSFRGRFNLTLFGNGTDAAMPVYFSKFGYSGTELNTGGEFHGWIRIVTPGSTNPTSYNYSGYNNWANFNFQARFDLVHWNAKPHLFAIEHYIPYGRAGIFDIDVSSTQSLFTIWMLPGSYTVEFETCDGLTAHWRNNNDVGGAVDMREANSIVTRSPIAYASRDTRYDNTILWGANLAV